MAETVYTRFQARKLQTVYTFLYPDDWEVRELQTEAYSEVFLAKPLSTDDTFSVTVVVRSSVCMAQSPEEVADAFVSRYAMTFGARQLRRIDGVISGSPAIKVEIGYSMWLPSESIDARATPIRECRVFLVRQHYLHELAYTTQENDYLTWLPVFHKLTQTFTFLATQ